MYCSHGDSPLSPSNSVAGVHCNTPVPVLKCCWCTRDTPAPVLQVLLLVYTAITLPLYCRCCCWRTVHCDTPAPVLQVLLLVYTVIPLPLYCRCCCWCTVHCDTPSLVLQVLLLVYTLIPLPLYCRCCCWCTLRYPCPCTAGHRVHRVATAAFWRTFSHEGKISPGW